MKKYKRSFLGLIAIVVFLICCFAIFYCAQHTTEFSAVEEVQYLDDGESYKICTRNGAKHYLVKNNKSCFSNFYKELDDNYVVYSDFQTFIIDMSNNNLSVKFSGSDLTYKVDSHKNEEDSKHNKTCTLPKLEMNGDSVQVCADDCKLKKSNVEIIFNSDYTEISDNLDDDDVHIVRLQEGNFTIDTGDPNYSLNLISTLSYHLKDYYEGFDLTAIESDEDYSDFGKPVYGEEGDSDDN